MISQEIRDAITGGIKKEKLRELVYTSNVSTMLQDGLEKVLMGDTTLEEVLKLIELDDDEDTMMVNKAQATSAAAAATPTGTPVPTTPTAPAPTQAGGLASSIPLAPMPNLNPIGPPPSTVQPK